MCAQGTSQDIIRACAEIRLLTGQYRLKVDIAKLSNVINPIIAAEDIPCAWDHGVFVSSICC